MKKFNLFASILGFVLDAALLGELIVKLANHFKTKPQQGNPIDSEST